MKITKNVEVSGDMGYITKLDITIAFYGDSYIWNKAGYFEDEDMSEIDEDLSFDDFIEVAEKLSKNISFALLYRKMIMINDIDFYTVRIYKVCGIMD